MTSPITISGLSSGIDTNSVITSTLANAAGPQNAMKRSLNKLLNLDQAYQTINSAMAAFKGAADTMKSAATWQATAATSSDSTVRATGSTSALAGTSTTFSVTALAKAQSSTVTVANAANATAGTFSITVGAVNGSPGKTTTLTPTSTSAADLVTALNAANIGVKASLVTDSSNHTILQFASTSSGLANSFTTSGLTDQAGFQNITTAQDASITVGSVGAGGYTVSSSSNTFTNAVAGVTLTASAIVSNVTVSVDSDPSVAVTAAQNLVNAGNKALLAISNYTAQGAVLQGDSLVNGFTQEILSAVSGGSSSGKSYSLAGLDINSTGILTFDAAAFSSQFTADAAGTQALVGNLATAFSAVGDEASNTKTGSLTTVLSANSGQEATLTNGISDWDAKLAAQKTLLTAKYAAMEAALSKMKSQSTYLSQAFASLTGTTSTSK